MATKTDEKIEKIYETMNEIVQRMDKHSSETDSRLDAIEKILIAQETNLQLHMKRSDNLESLVEHLRQNEINEIVKHKNMVEGGLKMLGLIGLILGIISGAMKIF